MRGVLSVHPPVLWGYHLERGGMSFHDALGINCKKGATTENQSQVSSIRAKGCMFDDCAYVFSNFT